MERYCSTGRIPQWGVVPMEEEEKEEVLLGSRLASQHFCCIFGRSLDQTWRGRLSLGSSMLSSLRSGKYQKNISKTRQQPLPSISLPVIIHYFLRTDSPNTGYYTASAAEATVMTASYLSHTYS